MKYKLNSAYINNFLVTLLLWSHFSLVNLSNFVNYFLLRFITFFKRNHSRSCSKMSLFHFQANNTNEREFYRQVNNLMIDRHTCRETIMRKTNKQVTTPHTKPFITLH